MKKKGAFYFFYFVTFAPAKRSKRIEATRERAPAPARDGRVRMESGRGCGAHREA
jgi:hypothetical protein